MTLTASPVPFLLMPRVTPRAAPGLTLPAGKENLFERLIRDPTAPNRPARERLCAEMLCGLLINAPVTRQSLIRLLAELAGTNAKPLEELDWQFSTEQAIGAKRDDLRIEGWTHDDEPEQVVLWSVEIKVGAGIHVSSNQPWDEDESPAEVVEETDLQLVSQIKNYDAWLAKQPAKHRAGFVLAITDQSQNIPAALSMPWHCLRWTDLVRGIEEELRAGRIPDSEQTLARHFCGFVRSHLWNEDTMSDTRFDFDNLAFLRALPLIGNSSVQKADELVTSCLSIVNQYLAGSADKTGHLKGLRNTTNQSVVYAKLLPEGLKVPMSPILKAGISGGNARVWLESSPQSPARSIIRGIVNRTIGLLKDRNPDWEAVDDSTWTDLQLSRPLEWILTAEEQPAALNEFVTAAMNDLKETGFIAELVLALKKE